MRQIPVRELNQHTAGVLARVVRGERVEITSNGQPVAIIEPVQANPISGLIESGDVRPAEGPLPLLSGSAAPAPDSLGLDTILEDRYAEGRW